MRTRSLGKTGLRVSELGLGTWGLSGDAYGPADPAEAAKVVARAVDIGFSLFDTADAYGAGRAELLLADALAAQKGAVVVTKGGIDRATDPARRRFDREYLTGAVERSLKRLGRERLDVYLLHNPSPDALAVGDAVETMAALKKEGKIGHWGVSAGDVEVARAAIEKGAEVIEIAYNLFHSQDLHRLSGDIMVSGVGVLARSTLAHGLLAGDWDRDKHFSTGDHRADRWTRAELERRLSQLDAMRFLVHGDVRTLRGAAVRFVLANQLVSCAILGPRTVPQLEQLVREVGAGPTYLGDEELARIPHALSQVGLAT